MKNLFKVLIMSLFLCSINAYAFNEDNEESTEDYVETSQKVTEESHTYDIDMRPYVSFKFTSNKKEVTK